MGRSGGESAAAGTDPRTAPEGARLLDAVALMDRLCSEGPWESRQTHRSLARFLIEETYELLDAIESGDRDQLVGELGDVLLQVLFHARIGAGFDIDDVADAFIAKVSARSAGVLAGDVDLDTQVRDWERAKAAERPGGSVMDGIAPGQPALALAEKVLERAKSAGVPDDAIPASLTLVPVTAGGDAEQRLRAEALAFAGRMRAAEELLHAAGGASGDAAGDAAVGPPAAGDGSREHAVAEQWRAALARTAPGR